MTPGDEITHVDIDGVKAGLHECSRHFNVTIHPLLAQDCYARLRAGGNHRCDNFLNIEAQFRTQSLSGEIAL